MGTVLALSIGSCSEAVDVEVEEESGAAVDDVMILLMDGASLWCLLVVAVRVVVGEEERVAAVAWAVGDVIIARLLLGRTGKVDDAGHVDSLVMGECMNPDIILVNIYVLMISKRLIFGWHASGSHSVFSKAN